MSCDYVCHAEFMWYGNFFTPRKIFFVSVFDPNHCICVKVNESTLTQFTYEDVIKNQSMPCNPFEPGTECHSLHLVDYATMKTFLSKKLMPELLNQSGWPSVVGTLDTATFFYLIHFVPSLELLGADLLEEQVTVLTSKPNSLAICQAAADKLFIRRQNGPDPFWDV